MNNKNLLTGIKDVDRLVLDKIDDKQLLEMCALNKTYYNNVCDENYFRNRTFSKYPETIKYKDYVKIKNWKNHYLNVVHYKDLLKTDYEYDYKSEDNSPELFYLARKLVPKKYHYSKNNALNFATENGNLLVVKYLIENGADVTVGDNDPLKSASENGHSAIVKYLVKHGADINAHDNYALRYASSNGHLATVKYLVKHGADVTAEDNTAVIYASARGHLPVVKYLVKHGADITARDNDALRLASLNEHSATAAYLESL